MMSAGVALSIGFIEIADIAVEGVDHATCHFCCRQRQQGPGRLYSPVTV